MTYTLTPEQLESITPAEMAFSTTRLLPELKDIPKEFLTGNVYTRLVNALFYGRPLPEGDIEMREGFSSEALNRAVRAHLQSWSPKHEHKMAGVAYMVSCACTLTLDS